MKIVKLLYVCLLSLTLSALFLIDSFGKTPRDVGEDLIPSCYEHLDLFREKVEGQKHFPPSYQGEELAKLREWEKKWVGKKIDNTNVDEVKDLLPETLYIRLKDPEKWGYFYFTIWPYFHYRPSEGYMEATEKYSGSCTIGSKDELKGWTAGLPFLKWKTPLEFAWNMERAYWADDWYARGYRVGLVNQKKHTERYFVQNVNRLFYAGRTDLDPKPAYPKSVNPEGVRYSDILFMTSPADMKGIALLYKRYIDCSRDDDQWTYVPAMRRVRRVSTAQRTDTVGGSDLCSDDYHGYAGQFNKQTYKILGRKELLLVRHTDVGEVTRGKGEVNFSGFYRSKINTVVVEPTHKDPNYLYGKRVWYVGPESYILFYVVDYDKEGRLWKIHELQQSIIKKQMFNPVSDPIDYQRVHGSPAMCPKHITVNVGVTDADVSLKFLLDQAH